ncbi:MAG TPA: ADP-dependent glucokinase/phosphofructokinase [Methanothrix sp.]|nr:ADP-dependent glucokinase/phosphofructokinase [Methanothrix sp.]HOL43077.1 ADP-dependent glucokinase/phosphofructokinase [Methanothrix sp.]HPO88079.1 ADP-dependent glucokinase/phosphofructokinase [Methanothrix sp.]
MGRRSDLGQANTISSGSDLRVLCAFNVNIDCVHTITGKEIESLFRDISLSHGIREIPSEIASLETLSISILYHMRRGTGGELIINSEKVADEIASLFPWETRMGGNAGNIANVLAALGAEPVVNVPSLTPRQASLFHPAVRVPVMGGGVSLTDPVHASKEGQELRHFVIQYMGGESVDLPSGRITAPRENRIIATFDPMNRVMHINPAFRAFLERPDPAVRGVVLSGFHLVPYEMHREIFEERLGLMRGWLDTRYSHAEMGSFERPEIMRYLLGILEVDSIGMNEDELSMLVDSGEKWEEIAGAAEQIHDEFGIPRVCVHTREFTVSISPDPIKEIAALEMGAEIAGRLAATGCIEREVELGVNDAGRKAVEEVVRLGGTKAGLGAFKEKGGSSVCVHPSFVAPDPVTTVGLGDALTAATVYVLMKYLPVFRSCS